MILVENLSFSYPKKDLYDNISFNIEKGEHCALIGTSGSGKTTLIDIITGKNKYLYDGKVTLSEECKIGFTSQFYKHEAFDITVFDYIAQPFLEAQKNIDDICDKMADCEDLDTVMLEYQNALDEFDAIGGANYESLILKKLNLSNLKDHKDLSISLLSGGEFKLVQLIKEMISNQDLLIMDEPCAFLDFENLASLKNLINGHKGTLLVITHNRYLLNQCFNKILHLENTQIQEFLGKYDEYNLSLLEKKIDVQEIAVEDAIEIERNAKLIENLREIATSNAEAVHGKALKARVRFQKRLEARQTKEPFIYLNTPDYYFIANEIPKEENPSPIIKIDNFSLSYDEKNLLNNINLEVFYGDKIAIIGENGTGKTSLLRKIANINDASISVKDGLRISYLSQLQNETLNDNNTIYDEFFDAGFKTYEEIENHLAPFNFEKENLTSLISSLSGGEKNTLQMAKIAKFSTDILILDEPSSHLDIYSQVALEKAIKEFEGTVIMVSHDFYFIANCMDYILMIENKAIRKMSNRKFRQMIYSKHFDKDYLLIQEKYTQTINNLESAIYNKNFILARNLHEEASRLVKNL